MSASHLERPRHLHHGLGGIVRRSAWNNDIIGTATLADVRRCTWNDHVVSTTALTDVRRYHLERSRHQHPGPTNVWSRASHDHVIRATAL